MTFYSCNMPQINLYCTLYIKMFAFFMIVHLALLYEYCSLKIPASTSKYQSVYS